MNLNKIENVKKQIRRLHNEYPPDIQTPEIKKVLEALYKIESELMSNEKEAENKVHEQKIKKE